MKRMLIVGCMTALLAVGAFAQVFDFTIVNRTGYTIDAVHVTPADDNEWGEDVLGVDTLQNGRSVEIRFDSFYEALLLAFNIDKYDLRCDYSDGSTDEWHDLKLEDINELTLKLDGGGNGIASWR